MPSRDNGEAAKVADGDAKGSSTSTCDTTVVTLRCMYTNQKSKKRKVWSDGAVKCCSKRQRVALYRWSEVLGVTGTLLGEIYLSVPEYQAFTNIWEPELEMELYIVSLEGVAQIESSVSNDSNKETAEENVAAPGVFNGRKRKLLKPFKPPTRRASPAVLPRDSWEPTAGNDHCGNAENVPWGARGPQAEGRAGLTPRTSYTGFGHVESLWDQEEENDDRGLGEARGQGCDERSSGHEEFRQNTTYGGANTLMNDGQGPVAAAMRLSTAAANMNTGAAAGDSWELRNGGPLADDGYGSRSSTSEHVRIMNLEGLCAKFGLPDSQAHNGRGNWPSNNDAHGDESRCDTRESYMGRLKDDYGRVWEDGAADSRSREPTGRSMKWSESEEQRPRNQDKDNDNSTWNGGPAVEQGRNQDSNARECGGHNRSTQDILSLFGAFGEALPERPGADAVTVDGSRRVDSPHNPVLTLGYGRRDTGLELEITALDDPSPLGAQADMTRTQKEVREPEQANSVQSGSDTARAPSTAGPWACGLCGVRGSPSASSCRVCGARRQEGSRDCDGENGESTGDADGRRYPISSHRADQGGGGVQQRNAKEVGRDATAPEGWRQEEYGRDAHDRRHKNKASGRSNAEEETRSLHLTGHVAASQVGSLSTQWHGYGNDESHIMSGSDQLSHVATNMSGTGDVNVEGAAAPFRRPVGPRMEIDVGSSSDSEDG